MLWKFLVHPWKHQETTNSVFGSDPSCLTPVLVSLNSLGDPQWCHTRMPQPGHCSRPVLSKAGWNREGQGSGELHYPNTSWDAYTMYRKPSSWWWCSYTWARVLDTLARERWLISKKKAWVGCSWRRRLIILTSSPIVTWSGTKNFVLSSSGRWRSPGYRSMITGTLFGCCSRICSTSRCLWAAGRKGYHTALFFYLLLPSATPLFIATATCYTIIHVVTYTLLPGTLSLLFTALLSTIHAYV